MGLKKALLSNRAYAQKAGSNCPYCLSQSLESGQLVARYGDEFVRTVACKACGRDWLDVLAIKGYHSTTAQGPLEAPQPPEQQSLLGDEHAGKV